MNKPISLMTSFLAALALFITTAAFCSEYADYKEVDVTRSPAKAKSAPLEPGAKTVALAVSPVAPEALIVYKKGNSYGIALMGFTGKAAVKLAPPKGGDSFTAAVWHPDGRDVFLLGKSGGKSAIWRGAASKTPNWKKLYSTGEKLKNLVVSTSIFGLYTTRWDQADDKKTNKYESGAWRRIYFGVEYPGRGYGIRTVSEYGKAPYDVTAPTGAKLQKINASEEHEVIKIASSVPVGFHVSGDELFFEDGKKCIGMIKYEWSDWTAPGKSKVNAVCGSAISFTPNGIGFSAWRAGQKGVDLYYHPDYGRKPAAENISFALKPEWTADGRGLIGVTRGAGGAESLVYEPVPTPLADVANAWMFVTEKDDLKLLDSDGGAFRRTEYEQLCYLYDSESYTGEYDSRVPARPYLVTTDVFWEVFAASYEGIFQVVERREAIPALRKFINDSADYLNKDRCTGRLCKIFDTLKELNSNPKSNNPEVKRIMAADGYAESDVLGVRYEYEDLKPRGHYTKSEKLGVHFRSLRYLSSINFTGAELKTLRGMPVELRQEAFAFIKPYLNFIAPSRYDLVWTPENYVKPDYIKHQIGGVRIFPLSWGFDNEVLNSVVYHEDWPDNEQIGRMLPTSFDFPAVLGSPIAKEILKNSGVYKEFPNLAAVTADLEKRWGKKSGDSRGIYDAWLEALGTQWADTAAPEGSASREMWGTKRLQTGLASWATLRHATVLVNERSAAEAGKGGFEPIWYKPPLGAVEPDPATFKAIAGLVDMEIALVGELLPNDKKKLDKESKYYLDDGELDTDSLRAGLTRRLKGTRDSILAFRKMAIKQIEGKKLTPAEYDIILHVGGSAEHNFLVFKSLANDEFTISNPDPVSKIVDIAGGGKAQIDYLHAAVGLPTEWDLLLPFHGRRQVTKGVVYSYYDMVNKEIINDEEWREMLQKTDLPSWTKRFYAAKNLVFPAKPPF